MCIFAAKLVYFIEIAKKNTNNLKKDENIKYTKKSENIWRNKNKCLPLFPKKNNLLSNLRL